MRYWKHLVVTDWQQVNTFFVELKSFICHKDSIYISLCLSFSIGVDSEVFSITHFVQVIEIYVTNRWLTVTTIVFIVAKL